MKRDQTRQRSGYSLVELMVAVVVMAIVTTQLLSSFSRQHTTSVAQERVIETQEEVRIVTELIVSDLQMAGFMVPEFAAVGSIDGGTNGADVLCVSDPNVINDSVLAGASSRFLGAPVASGFSGATSSVSVSSADRDIDSDGDDDFVGGFDRVLYEVDGALSAAALTIEAELCYQPLGARWLAELAPFDTPEVRQLFEQLERTPLTTEVVSRARVREGS